MEKKNPIKDKSYSFALKIIALYRQLIANNEYVIGKQIVRSGTSIGANVEEALHGQSKRDFIAKLSISLKEAHETNYWLRLLRDSSLLDVSYVQPLLLEINELISILTSIIKTSRQNLG